ncbi:MAG: DUF3426 domain-containing protein [Phaeospirillum sp.]|nr:DUF3426 domain-containing protein [Phaeospirillum sp.]
MLISCPNCATNFSIPDSALGATGRKLKCAKCGHKWHQQPLMVMEEEDADFDLGGPSFSAPSAFSPPPQSEPDRQEPRFDAPTPPAGRSSESDLDDFDIESPPIPNFGRRIAPEPGDDDLSSNTLLDDGPQPIPDVFSTAQPDAKKGTGFLWVLLILLVLGGLGGAGYYFQDQVVEFVPEAGELMAQVGLRHEKPGAGLELRKAGTPERFVHNDTDVLVVRGIIANITDRVRPVPTMKLVLMDKNKLPVQEKLSQPPVTALDPQGTASFKIMLERPDPNAVEVVVVFVESAADAKPAPPAPKPLAPPVIPDVAPAPPAQPPAPPQTQTPAPAAPPPAEAKPEAK